MKTVLFSSMLCMLAVHGFAQKPEAVQVAKMQKVSFLAGHWEGAGWILTATGQKRLFSQTEDVEMKLNGLILIIEGRGTGKESPQDTVQVVHRAYAVLSYDSNEKKFVMRAYDAEGHVVDADGRVNDDGSFEWGFERSAAGKVKFTIHLNEHGEWHEVGAVSKDGSRWFQNFEMTLAREPR